VRVQMCQNKAVVGRPRSSAAEHHLQPAKVRVSVAAAQSEDSQARRLRVPLPVEDKAEKNADSPESVDLRRHRLPVQVRAKHAADEREGRVRMVNLPVNQEPERLLPLSAGKRSRSTERKKERGPHRREDHNNFLLITLAAPEQKPGPFFRASVVGRLCQTPTYCFHFGTKPARTGFSRM
jgi:hypothetical protein